MYRDLREGYWWHGMKKDVAKFVSDSPNYLEVKVA